MKARSYIDENQVVIGATTLKLEPIVNQAGGESFGISNDLNLADRKSVV